MSTETRESAPSAVDTPRRRVDVLITGCADVLVDGCGRLGRLSYLVPADIRVKVGDEVQVPFGKQTRRGVVLGPGTPERATRDIEAQLFSRALPRDMAYAGVVARYHFVEPQAVISRLAPRNGRDDEPLQSWDVALAPPARRLPAGWDKVTASRRLLIRAPFVDPVRLAVEEAARLAAQTGGQVLVLCPSADNVAETIRHFTSGAARLDASAPSGAWRGWREGTLRIGVGTRSGALLSAEHLAGFVVVDEEHPGHTESSQPHTNARDLASARSRAGKLALTLISALPSVQALVACAEVSYVGNSADWPSLEVVNRSTVDPHQRMLPGQLATILRRHEKAGHTPVIVVQRKAAVRRCARCATARPCTSCTSSLCRHPEVAPCDICSETAVRMTGWDAERVADLAGPRVRVIGASDLTSVHDAGCVVVFDIDAALAAPELLPGTFAASLLTRAAAAAGRGGTLVACTDDPRHPVLVNLLTRRDPAAVTRDAAAEARSAGLPPFGRLICVRTVRKSAPKVDEWPGRVHGPRKIGEEWEILVSIPAADVLSLEPHLGKLRRGGKTRISVS